MGATGAQRGGEGLTVLREDIADRAAALVAQSVPGADHAIVIVADGRRLPVVGASSEPARHIGGLLLALGEDGAPPAIRDALHVDESDLSGTPMWPQGAATLEGVGIGGLVGRRLLVGARRVGFLAAVSERPGALSGYDPERLDTFAEVLAGWIVASEQDTVLQQLHSALKSSRTIGQAVGLLMGREGILGDEAFALMRGVSNDTNTSVRDVAAGIIDAHEDDIRSQR